MAEIKEIPIESADIQETMQDVPEDVPNIEEGIPDIQKKGRGRPAGAKNKPKQTPKPKAKSKPKAQAKKKPSMKSIFSTYLQLLHLKN